MKHSIQSIEEMQDINDKFVLVRTDYNVPVKDGVIKDDYRIKKSLPTLEYLVSKGAKVLIISHIWEEETKSLEIVCTRLRQDFPQIGFIKDHTEAGSKEKILNMVPGDILMFENLRLNDGEMANSLEFAESLSAHADIYVNEAFPVSHRSHASVVTLPKLLPAYAGLQFYKEVSQLSQAFNPARPFLFILGGAKFETKIPLVQKFFELADKVFIGGALAHDFFKAKGLEIGVSLHSEEKLEIEHLMNNEKLILPTDVVVSNGTSVSVKRLGEILPDDNILDVGPETLAKLQELIEESNFVLWNGPLGDYKHGFEGGTVQLSRTLASSSASSVVGGGDTLAAIAGLDIEDKFSLVSTGGGAMLEFLSAEGLVGVEALENTLQPV
jgi:phosphoglycerate kinase